MLLDQFGSEAAIMYNTPTSSVPIVAREASQDLLTDSAKRANIAAIEAKHGKEMANLMPSHLG